MPRIDRPTTSRRALLLGLALVLGSLSCGREATGLPDGVRVMRGFTFDARFDQGGLANGVASELVSFARVRVVLRNTLGETVVDQVVDFPSTAEEVPVALTVPLTPGTPASGETMQLSLAFANAQGDTVFRGGPVSVRVAPTVPGVEPPPVPQVPIAYTGPGAAATQVVIATDVDTLLAGSAFTYTAQALDGQGQPIAGTPIAWRSETPTRATVAAPGAGAGTTLAARGPALIIAQLLTGPADTVRLEVLPRAQALTLVSGNNQPAGLGTTLPQPLVVRVTATDGQPMAGVSVTFAVFSGGGSLSGSVVTTDANGLAQVSWTTGTGLGLQAVHATVAGLTGSPVVFSAQAPLTQLIHHYPMNGSVADAVGGQDGTLLGGATVAEGELRLLGNGGYAELPGRLVPANESFTVSLFVRNRTSLTLAASYLSQGATGDGFYIGHNQNGRLRAGETWQDVGVVATSDGLYRHYVVTSDLSDPQQGPISRFFVNGTQVAVSADVPGGPTGTATRLGRQFGALEEYLNGDIDEVRIYRGALSAAQVAALYTAGVSAPGRLVFLQQPTSVNSGATMVPPVVVRAEDGLGRVKADYNGPVSIALGANPGGATLGGTLTVNAVSGVATFADLTVSAAGAGYTLVATATGATPATSVPFSVTAVGGLITWTNPSSGSWNVPGNWSLGRVPTPEDTVLVDLAGTYTVSLESAVTVAALTVGGGAGSPTLLVGSHALTVTGQVVVAAGATVTIGLGDGSLGGSGPIVNRGMLQLEGGSVQAPLTNEGLILARATSAIAGALTTSPGSTLRVESNATFANINLTIANGFTNNGTIDLTSAPGGQASNLILGAGTLVNASGGVITMAAGAGGNRGLGARLENAGLLEVQATGSLFEQAVAHLNTGTVTIAENGNLIVWLDGGGTFTNTGTVTGGVGALLELTGAGTFSHDGGTLAGEFLSASNSATLVLNAPAALGQLTINSSTLALGSGVTTAGSSLTLFNSLVTGSGTLVVDADQTLLLQGTTIGTPVTVAGTVNALGSSSILGAYTSQAGSALLVFGSSSAGNATLTIGDGFENHGDLVLGTADAGPESAELVVSAGTLVNAVDGGIDLLPGGARTITGALSNAGTMRLGVLETGALTVTGAFANTGTLELDVSGPGSHDVLTVGGTATLGGTMSVVLVGGYVPATGTTFPLIAATAVSGTFATVNAQSPLVAVPTYLATGVVVTGPVALLPNVWTNTSGGLWSEPTNWSLGRVPTASDTVQITTAGTYTVTLDVNPTVAGLVVGGATGTQTLTASARTVVVNGPWTMLSGGVFTGTTVAIGGTGAITNGGSFLMTNGSVGMAFVNEGTLALRGNAAVNGVLTTAPASTIEVLASAATGGGASATIANGFTNTGTILLRTLDAFYSNQLSVTNGTLVNAAGGVIRTIAGNGTKTLTAQLDNQGLVELNEGLSLNRASAAHVNGGTFSLVTGNLSVTQSGTTPSFTNTGTITVPSGRTLSVTGGSLTLTGGTLDAAAGSLQTNNVTLIADIATLRTRATLTNTTLPGTFTIPAGDTLRLFDGSPTMTLVNNGALLLHGNTVLGGTVTTGDTTSVIEVRASSAAGGGAAVTITNGFTNTGRLEFRTLDAFYGTTLTVVNGTLLNAPTGIIRTIAGFGSKTLNAVLDNQGLVDLREAFTMNRTSAAHVNSGTIDLVTGNLQVTQGGTTPSFTNSGTINVPSGRTLSVGGGTLTLTGGTLNAASGSLQTNNVTLNADITQLRTRATLTTTTLPGTFTIPAGDTLRLFDGSPTMTLVNNGALLLHGGVVLNGTVTTGDTTSVIEVRASAASGGGASATITNGFTNTGRIEFRTLDAFYSNQLAITNGSLVNAPTGIIRTLAGNGGKTLVAQLDNQGLVDLREQLTLSRASSAHVNSGTITLASGNLSVAQTGTTPSFTNAGTITVPSGRTLSVTGGTLTLTGGTLDAAAGILQTNNVTLNADITQLQTRATLTSTTLPGTFTIPAGDTLRLYDGSPTMTLVNNGALLLHGGTVLGGTVTTGDTTSVIEIRASAASGGGAGPTITNGFTNTGRLEFRTLDAFYSNTLFITNGPLVNAPTGIIRTLAGNGGKTLTAALQNQGLVDLREQLNLNGTSAAHLNSGTIALTTGNFLVAQGGTSPSFTNTGTISVPANRTFSVTGGTLTLAGGTLDAANGVLSTNNVTLNADIATLQTRATLTNTTIPGTFTIPAGDTLRLYDGSPTMTLVNNGALLLHGSTVLGGTVTTGDTTSVIEVRASAASGGGANVTVTNAFTNTGRLEFRTLDAFYSNQLTVTNGTLVNAPAGIIRTLAGNGSKTLSAVLDNQGLVDLREQLNLSRASAAHLNSGTIALVTGNMAVSQSGTAPSFTNTGTITVPSGRSFSNSGGTLDLTTGSFGGQGGVLSTTGTSLAMTIPSMRARATLSSTTVLGTLVIPANDSLVLVDGSPTMTVENQGLLVLGGGMTVGGTLTSVAGSTVEVRANAAFGGGANVTFANAYTNNGIFRTLTADAFYSSTVSFTNGTFVNAAGGTVISTGLGSRTMSAAGGWANSGTWSVDGSLSLSSGAFAQNSGGTLTVASGTTLTLAGLLTLNLGSTTTVNGTLTANGGCSNLGGLLTGTFLCP